MTFKFFRLRGIERELAKLNANLELIMIHSLGITPHSTKKVTSLDVEETTVEYLDEGDDFEREIKEKLGRVKETVE